MDLYDLHNHTYLSACGSRNAFPEDYIKEAEANGLKLIGFSDHAWEQSVPGAWEWYRPQGFERLAETRKRLENIETDVKIVFGAECEFNIHTLAMNERSTENLDYAIVPHSHTHIKGYVLPKGWESPEKHAEYLIKSFYALCTHPERHLFFGIAHPMYPNGTPLEEAELIYKFISDESINECLCAAAENGIYLELNTGTINRIGRDNLSGSYYERFFRLVSQSGCRLFSGSDKHTVIKSGQPDPFIDIEKYMAQLGLEPEMFSDALEHMLAVCAK